jgi:hypothetical protein
MLIVEIVAAYSEGRKKLLTLWRRNVLLNFSTPCILNVNNTGTKQGSIIK